MLQSSRTGLVRLLAALFAVFALPRPPAREGGAAGFSSSAAGCAGLPGAGAPGTGGAWPGIIIPPAAYLAHNQGEFSLAGVVLAGTLGSWVGASFMYWAARLLGYPVVLRFGRYVGFSAVKLEMAERWCARYGAPGVFRQIALMRPDVREAIVDDASSSAQSSSAMTANQNGARA